MIANERHKKLFGFASRQSASRRIATGFTLVEIILVLGIFAILLGFSFAAIGSFRDDSDLDNDANNIQAVLRLAQNRTVSSNGDTRYGVYFNTASTPHEYILFQTETDYLSGTVDTVYQVSDFVQFSLVDFNPLAGQEVVFDRIQGTTSNDGNVVLQSTKDAGKTRAISVSGGGDVGINAGSAPTDDDRLKDSRHVHIDYTRNPSIDIVNEIIRLTFSSSTVPNITHDIVIANNLSGGQIVWEGEIDFYGEPQKLKIHTHELNNGFDSQFSVHRDARFNTKALTIELNGGTLEDTGTLIQYNALGAIASGTSIYVTDTQEQ